MGRRKSNNNSQPIQVATNGKAIAGYRQGMYWFGCNGRTVYGLCSASFKDERDLLQQYDSAFGPRGAAGGLIRVYEDGETLVLRKDPKQIAQDEETQQHESELPN